MTDTPPLLPEAKVFGEPKSRFRRKPKVGFGGGGPHPDDMPTVTSLQIEVNILRRQLNAARLMWIAQGIVLLILIFGGKFQ